MSKSSIDNPFAILLKELPLINERIRDPFTYVTDNQPFFVAQRLEEGQAQLLGHMVSFLHVCENASSMAQKSGSEHEIAIKGGKTRNEAIIALYDKEGKRVFHS